MPTVMARILAKDVGGNPALRGLRRDLRLLYWIMVANLAGVAALWIIAIILALHFILRDI